MAPTTPTGVPAQVTAGDSWRWRIADLLDYPNSESWALKYEIVGNGTTVTVTPTFQTSGDDANHWLVSVATTTTDDFTNPGRYRIIGRMVGTGSYAGREETISDDVLIILRNPRSATAAAFQTHAERTLALIETAIEGRIPEGLENYQVAGRAISKIPMQELLKLRGRYAGLVQRERTGRTGRRHLVQFPASA